MPLPCSLLSGFPGYLTPVLHDGTLTILTDPKSLEDRLKLGAFLLRSWDDLRTYAQQEQIKGIVIQTSDSYCLIKAG